MQENGILCLAEVTVHYPLTLVYEVTVYVSWHLLLIICYCICGAQSLKVFCTCVCDNSCVNILKLHSSVNEYVLRSNK